jgi:hypothetical protein
MARLRVVLAPDETLTEVADWRELDRVLHTRPVDVMVLDPRANPAEPIPVDLDAPSHLLTLLTEFRSVPTILYSTHTREGLRAVLPLARAGVQQVLFRDFDVSRDHLRALLDEVAAGLMAERLLAEILPRLAAVAAPEEVVQAIARLFRTPQAFRTVHQVATVAGRRRGQLDRWMLRAGLAPAKVLMIAARVAWTHHYLRAPGNRFKTLALRLGYRDTAALGGHVRRISGMTPTTLPRSVGADDLLPILLPRVMR